MNDRKESELETATSRGLFGEEILSGLVNDEVEFLLGENSSFGTPMEDNSRCNGHLGEVRCCDTERLAAEVGRTKKRGGNGVEAEDFLSKMDYSTRTAKEVQKE